MEIELENNNNNENNFKYHNLENKAWFDPKVTISIKRIKL